MPAAAAGRIASPLTPLLMSITGLWYEGCRDSFQAKEEKRMGRGDKRSKKGKIWRGTHGKARPKKKKVVEKSDS